MANKKLTTELLILQSVVSQPQKALFNTVARKDKDSGSHLFKNERPGQAWNSVFFRRNPAITKREAESNNKVRAILSEESIRNWHYYLEANNLMDVFVDPNKIINEDESGFSLCPKTGEVFGRTDFKIFTLLNWGTKKKTLLYLLYLMLPEIWL